eukprot:scpid57181/ scgid0991/ 
MSRNWCSLVVAVASLALLLLHPWIARSPAPPVAKQRVLFVTLEYADPIFSGNGVLSRTMVNALLALDYEVLVVCAVPSTSASDLLSSSSSAEHALQRFNGSSGTSHSLLSVAVPVSKWLRLDRHSAWQEFAMGMASLRSQVEAFGVDIVMAVDWSGWHALERLKDLWRSKPAYFLNFRVFSRSTELLQSDGDRRFYADHECCALANSTSTIALSCYDACRLHALCQSCPGGSLGAGVAAGLDPSRATVGELSAESPDGCMRHCARAARQADVTAVALSVLRPPVRSDMLRVGRTHRRRTLGALDNAGTAWSRQRRFVTCCVRQSPEKNAMLFADLAVEMAAFLRNRSISLRLCGAVADQSYASLVKSRIAEAGVQVEYWGGFSSTDKLMEAFQTSLLNIHPSLHDAFGMTVVEAAAVATPSLIHDDIAVGVSEVFSHGEVFRVNLSAPIKQVAEVVQRLLSRRVHLASVGRRAQRQALTFTQTAYQLSLSEIINRVNAV